MKQSAALLLLLTSLAWPTPAQNRPAEAPTRSAAAAAPLSQDQIRELIREAAEKDIQNDKKQRDYTYIQREEEHKLGGNDQIKSSESKTYEIMVLYEEQVRKLIAKDDKPLSENDARKEDEKVEKIIEKRKNESESDRLKRREKQDKEQEQGRQFVKEISDAYNFRSVGAENLEGRETLVIDGDPRPGYEPRMKDAKFLPKFRFRVWLDQAEKQWVKLDIHCIDTVSVGLFLLRLHQGSNIQIEQVRVNDEVWLPRHIAIDAGRAAGIAEGVKDRGGCDLPRLQEVSYRYEDRSGGRAARAVNALKKKERYEE